MVTGVATVYRCSYVSYDGAGTQYVNTFHVQTDLNSPDDDEPDISDVAGAVDSHLRVKYLAVVPTSLTLSSLETREELPKGSPDIPSAFSIAINTAGTLVNANSFLPVAQATIISIRSTAAIRSGRGYIALPSPRDSTYMASGGLLASTGTYWTALGQLAALLDDTLTIGTISPVSVHFVVYSRTRHQRGESPYTFHVTEAVPKRAPRWRRSRTTSP